MGYPANDTSQATARPAGTAALYAVVVWSVGNKGTKRRAVRGRSSCNLTVAKPLRLNCGTTQLGSHLTSVPELEQPLSPLFGDLFFQAGIKWPSGPHIRKGLARG